MCVRTHTAMQLPYRSGVWAGRVAEQERWRDDGMLLRGAPSVGQKERKCNRGQDAAVAVQPGEYV